MGNMSRGGHGEEEGQGWNGKSICRSWQKKGRPCRRRRRRKKKKKKKKKIFSVDI
jgi:hypothetical protein